MNEDIAGFVLGVAISAAVLGTVGGQLFGKEPIKPTKRLDDDLYVDQKGRYRDAKGHFIKRPEGK